jgi:hypothetical protein
MQTFSLEQKQELKDFFNQHGWVHIKNVFSGDEIDRLRKLSYKMREQNYRGDLLAFPETTDLLFDDRIMSVTSLLLETDKPVYFGDSSGYNIGAAGASGFHKDNPDKFNGALPDWKSDYTIIRMGIYCQSHVNYSASLSLRDRSHHTASSEKGKPFFVNNEKGDLLIWSLRTSHSGNSMRLRFAPNLFLHPRWYNKLPNFLFTKQEKERIAYFMTFGKADAHLKRYLTYMFHRKYMIKSWQQSKYSADLIERVKAKNKITLINMHEVFKNTDIDQVEEKDGEMKADVPLFDFSPYVVG